MKLPRTKELRKLLYWMEERQRIYLKRQKGDPFPWTKDPILQRVKFCNTFREQDRVTVWLRENWREPFKNHPNLWFAMCIARQINWPETLEDIEFPEEWNPRQVLKVLEARKKFGKKVYTSAYLLGGGVPEGTSKAQYLVYNVLNPLWKENKKEQNADGAEFPSTLEGMWQWLLTFTGFGNFLAYETVTDLRHTRYLCEASDIQTWANAGPGAKRGLNRLYKRDLKAGSSQQKLLDEMILVMNWLKCERNPLILPQLELRDVEHSLCEFDKYVRAQNQMKETGKIVGLDKFRHLGLL